MDKVTLLVQRNYLGIDDELGKKLFVNFFRTLATSLHRPDSILFIHSSVFSLLEDSSIYEPLSLFVEDGVKLLACQTCCEYYQISDQLKHGSIVTMSDIEYEMFTHRVITL